MQTTETDLLFQTDSQLVDTARRQRKLQVTASLGRPINLSSKVLGIVVQGNKAWTAESGWQARYLDLESGKTLRIFKGHRGPVTCIAVLHLKERTILVTGSWDKTIRFWDNSTGAPLVTLDGHADFVKSVTILPGPALLSTSSDRTIRLWDLRPLVVEQTPAHIQTLRQHTRPVDCTAWRQDSHAIGIHVWTGDSLGVIKQWTFDAEAVDLKFEHDIAGHQTSISQLRTCTSGLWSSSMDNHAILHRFNGKQGVKISESTYIRTILPLDHIEGADNLVVTGSEDENLRLWDVEDIDCGQPRQLSLIPGHAEQLSDLGIAFMRGGFEIVSTALDQTIRRWTLQDLLHPVSIEEAPTRSASAMTDEEAKELEDLLSDAD